VIELIDAKMSKQTTGGPRPFAPPRGEIVDPPISDRFEIQGLSLSKAFAHPALGPALGSEDNDAR
jgi:hypothetical protein